MVVVVVLVLVLVVGGGDSRFQIRPQYLVDHIVQDNFCESDNCCECEALLHWKSCCLLMFTVIL